MCTCVRMCVCIRVSAPSPWDTMLTRRARSEARPRAWRLMGIELSALVSTIELFALVPGQHHSPREAARLAPYAPYAPIRPRVTIRLASLARVRLSHVPRAA
jgi:hypothetical protein